ncbi:MAG: hypothetical protein JWN57_2700 [Frankiales bacterium]|nr:hypothetical protein [Frankiales bacterium]
MVWQYEALSDYDLETVARDLLAEHWRVRVDSFPRGKDGGVDLLVRGPASCSGLNLAAGQDLVVLVKHYPSASAAEVQRAFRKDMTAPAVRGAHRLALVTTARLTLNARAALARLDPARLSVADVHDRERLDALLVAHPSVARSNTKLWLADGDVIDQVMHSGAWQRLSAFMNGLERNRRLLVETPAYHQALEGLQSRGSVILTGAPGVGKTSTARLLALHMLAADPALQVGVAVSALDEAFDLVDRGGRRLVVYDDFLGPTLTDASLRKNEAREIGELLARAAEDPDLLLVLTSRGHVLRQAERKFEHLGGPIVGDAVVRVAIEGLGRGQRLHLLRNQLWFSPLQPLLDTPGSRPWSDVVDHPNYNPRHCESAIGALSRGLGLMPSRARVAGPEEQRLTSAAIGTSRDDVVAGLRAALDDTEALWRHIVDEQLSPVERDVLLTMATLPACRAGDLLKASRALATAAGRPPTRHSEHAGALHALLHGLLHTAEEPPVDDSPIRFDNPGVREVAERRASDPEHAPLFVAAAVHFEQVDRLSRLLAARHAHLPVGELSAAAIRTLRQPNPAVREDLFADTPSARQRDPVPLAARLRRAAHLAGGADRLDPDVLEAAAAEIAEALRTRRLHGTPSDQPGRRPRRRPPTGPDDGLALPVSDVVALIRVLHVEPGQLARTSAVRLHHELFELATIGGSVQDLIALAGLLDGPLKAPALADDYRPRLGERLAELSEDLVADADEQADRLDGLVEEWLALDPPEPVRVRDEYDDAEFDAQELLDRMDEFAEAALAVGCDDPCEDSQLREALEEATEHADRLAPSQPQQAPRIVPHRVLRPGGRGRH